MLLRNQTEGARDAVDRDAANLLYRHGVSGILISLLASSGLALISIGQVPFRMICGWWVLMSAVLAVRGLDVFSYRFRKSSDRTGIQVIRRFGSGLIAT